MKKGEPLGRFESADAGRMRLADAPPDHWPVLTGAQVSLLREPNHPTAESVRLLRTELLLRHDRPESANALALLSPCRAEGRSRLTAELAVSFAQLGQRTLLVDADLRTPCQHLLFGIDNNQGLTEALIRQQSPVLKPVRNVEDLSVLTAGSLPANPLELLSRRPFEELVEGWLKEFAVVLFDTPALERGADCLVIATIVGRVLIVGRSHRTTYRHLKELTRRLQATRAQVLGSVLGRF